MSGELQLRQLLLCLTRLKKEQLSANTAPLSHRRSATDHSLFYRYFYRFCSAKLPSIVFQLTRPVRVTRPTEASHQFAIELRNSRTDHYDRTIVPRVSRLWNSGPLMFFSDAPTRKSSNPVLTNWPSYLSRYSWYICI